MATSVKLYISPPNNEANVCLVRETVYDVETHGTQTGDLFITVLPFACKITELEEIGIAFGQSCAVFWKRSLGNATDGIAIGTDVSSTNILKAVPEISSVVESGTDVQTMATKYTSGNSEVAFSIADINTAIIKYIDNAEENGISVGQSAGIVLGYYRLLSEMDSETLATYDDMTIRDVDYIIR